MSDVAVWEQKKGEAKLKINNSTNWITEADKNCDSILASMSLFAWEISEVTVNTK